MKSGLSVIVCCYNSAGRLPDTLSHLLNQQLKQQFNWEIIVVDNASKDNTTATAEHILKSAVSSDFFKVVQESQPGLSSARRKGYLTAQYDLLLFCDDDNWMNPEYFQLAHEIIRSNPEIGILGGKGEAVFEGKKPSWFDTYQLNFAVGEQASCNQQYCYTESAYGAGFIVRKKIFDNLDSIGFASLLSDRKGDQLISGGDTELCFVTRMMGYKIAYCPALTFKHLMTAKRMTWNYLKELHFGFGKMRVYTHAYKAMETTDTIPGQTLRIPLWLDKYIYRFAELRKMYLSTFGKLNKEGNDSVLKYYALRGEMSELWELKGKYVHVFETILSFKHKLKKLNS